MRLSRCDLAGAGVQRAGAWMCDLLWLFLSLSSIFMGCNSFEGKIRPEMVLHHRGLILQSTQKINFS